MASHRSLSTCLLIQTISPAWWCPDPELTSRPLASPQKLQLGPQIPQGLLGTQGSWPAPSPTLPNSQDWQPDSTPAQGGGNEEPFVHGLPQAGSAHELTALTFKAT